LQHFVDIGEDIIMADQSTGLNVLSAPSHGCPNVFLVGKEKIEAFPREIVWCAVCLSGKVFEALLLRGS
jgi:hypothetical protein